MDSQDTGPEYRELGPFALRRVHVPQEPNELCVPLLRNCSRIEDTWVQFLLNNQLDAVDILSKRSTLQGLDLRSACDGRMFQEPSRNSVAFDGSTLRGG